MANRRSTSGSYGGHSSGAAGTGFQSRACTCAAPARIPAAASSAPVPALSLDPTAGWQRVDLANLGVLNTLQDVIVFDDVLLAAGSAGDAGEKPVVIRSADGIDWSAEDTSSAFASPTSSP